MPRPSENFIPAYRKHKASKQAVVTICGTDFYLGPHGTKASRVEYDRLITEWLASGRSASFGATQEELLISGLLVAFLNHAKKYYGKGPKSEYYHYRCVARPVRELYSSTRAAEFGPLQFKAIRQRLVGDGGARTFVNAQMGRVKRIFKWGASEGMVPPSVHQSLAMVSGLLKGRTEARETAPILPVDESTVEATLEHMPPVVADMVRFQRLTGCRPSEVCILRPFDLDRSEEVWTYRPESHKTEHHGRDRVIFIGPQAQGILLRYLVRDSQTCCFRPVDSEAKRRAAQHEARKTPLQYGNRPGTNRKRKPKRIVGDRYTTDTYRRAIHRACDRSFLHPTLGSVMKSEFTDKQKSELRKWQSEHRWSPNRLRHSAATDIRKQFGLEGAQIVLGHASADITQVYAERDAALGTRIAKAIG